MRAISVLLLCVGACGSSGEAKSPDSKQCRESAGDDVKMGARTGVEGVKTGVKTGVEGVKTFGSAVGGWVEGGSDEARREWNEGKRETKKTANEGAAETDKAASVPECP